MSDEKREHDGVYTLRLPERMTPDAMKAAIEELDGKPLPVRGPYDEQLGHVALTFDEDTNDIRAELQLFDTDKAMAARALLAIGGSRLGFGVSGQVLEREGNVITKMFLTGVDMVRPVSITYGGEE